MTAPNGDLGAVERCGHESTSKLIRRLAVEVDEAMRDDQDEALTLAEAALESSYSTRAPPEDGSRRDDPKCRCERTPPYPTG